MSKAFTQDSLLGNGGSCERCEVCLRCASAMRGVCCEVSEVCAVRCGSAIRPLLSAHANVLPHLSALFLSFSLSLFRLLLLSPSLALPPRPPPHTHAPPVTRTHGHTHTRVEALMQELQGSAAHRAGVVPPASLPSGVEGVGDEGLGEEDVVLNGEGEGDKRYEALLLQSFVHQVSLPLCLTVALCLAVSLSSLARAVLSYECRMSSDTHTRLISYECRMSSMYPCPRGMSSRIDVLSYVLSYRCVHYVLSYLFSYLSRMCGGSLCRGPRATTLLSPALSLSFSMLPLSLAYLLA